MKLFKLTTFFYLFMIHISIAGMASFKPTVAAGRGHTIMIDSKGRAWSTGEDCYGQLGLGLKYGASENIPKTVFIECHPNVRFHLAAAGAYHTILIDEDGQAWAFGSNHCGQLGLQHKRDQYTPQRITIEKQANIRFKMVAAGANHTILIDEDGQAWAAGKNNYGQLGLKKNKNQNRFKKIAIKKRGAKLRFKMVATGYSHTILIDEDGRAWAFGKNDCGQLGRRKNKNQNKPHKIAIKRLPHARFNFAAAGGNHTILIDNEEHTWAFGKNDYGQLGLGNEEKQNTPTLINPPDTNFNFAACGYEHTIVIDHNGQAWSTGNNLDTQLGLGEKRHQNSFQKFTVIENPSDVCFNFAAAGSYHSILIDEEGQVWAFGDNRCGELGFENEWKLDTPQLVTIDGEPLKIMSPFLNIPIKNAKSAMY